MGMKPINTFVQSLLIIKKASVCTNETEWNQWRVENYVYFIYQKIKFMELLLSVDYKRLSQSCYILAGSKYVMCVVCI